MAYSGYAVVQDEMGQVDLAIESLNKALQLMEPVLLDNPEEKFTTRFMLNRKHRLVVLKALGGDTDYAWTAMEELEQEWQQLLQADSAQDENIRGHVSFLLAWASLAQSMDATEKATRMLEDAQGEITKLLEKLPADIHAGNLLMQTVFQTWELKQELPPESVLMRLPDYSRNEGRTRACQDAKLAAKKAVMLGNNARASELTAYLLGNGYTEVSFVRFCKAYSLCPGQ